MGHGKGTIAVWGGETGRERFEHATQVPIVPSFFTFPTVKVVDIDRLARHPAVERVNYPGLELHERHDVARRQMRGFGGMLSFAVRGGFEAFLSRLEHAHRAANLGCVERVVGPPAVTSHVECTEAERRAAGIPEGLVRYSTGIEDVEDLVADLEQALAAIK